MRRENRANLFFLIVFLAFSLPGAVILFRKKLDPSAPRMDLPDPVAQRLPYMTPPPTPTQVRWIVPEKTGAWLAEITRSRIGVAVLSAVPPGPKWEPVISDDHRVQVIGVAEAGGSSRIGLLLWYPRSQDDMKPLVAQIEKSGGGGRQSLPPAASQALDVPPEVRHELVTLGFTKPPAQVRWMEYELPETLRSGETVQLTLTGGEAPALHTSVEFVVR